MTDGNENHNTTQTHNIPVGSPTKPGNNAKPAKKPAKKTPAKKKKPEPPKMAWRITAKRHNFRRCGVAHSGNPVEYPADRFSKDEIIILEAEPMLVVQAL